MDEKKNEIQYNAGIKENDTIDNPIDTDRLKTKHKIEIEILKHKIITNIYRFLVLITSKIWIIVIIFITLFIVYPLSKISIGFISNEVIRNFIQDYCSYILDAIKIFGSFIVGAIISDWSSSKIKNE